MSRPTSQRFVPRSSRPRTDGPPTPPEQSPWGDSLTPTEQAPATPTWGNDDPASVATPPRRQPDTDSDWLADRTADSGEATGMAVDAAMDDITELDEPDATRSGPDDAAAESDIEVGPAPAEQPRPVVGRQHGDVQPAAVEVVGPVEPGLDDPQLRAPATPAPVTTEQAPSAQLTRPAAAPAADEDVPDVDDVFSSVAVRRRGVGRAGLAQVVLSLSGSGGVGKTTFSMALAERAAARGKRVVLIDGNVGQGDVSSFLRVHNADLPTMYDAVVLGRGNLRRALVAPAQLQAVRDARLAPVRFALLQAPTLDELRTGRITATSVADLVRQAKEIADLVVVDTQIIEPDDPRRMLGSMILPALGQGGWALTLTSLSAASVSNAVWLMDALAGEGIATSHIMSVLSRVPVQVEMQTDRLRRLLSSRSVHLGTAWDDDDLLMAMNRGEPIGDQRTVAHLVDQVLEAVFNIEAQATPYDPHARPQKRGWLRRGGRS